MLKTTMNLSFFCKNQLEAKAEENDYSKYLKTYIDEHSTLKGFGGALGN